MFLRNNTPYVERSDLISAHVEALCLEIRKPKSKPILVSTSYRLPCRFKYSVSTMFRKIWKTDDESKEIIIADDFNCDLLKKDFVNPSIKKIKDLIDIYQLQQHIDRPSRITNCSQPLFDIILTKIDDTKTTDSGSLNWRLTIMAWCIFAGK